MKSQRFTIFLKGMVIKSIGLKLPQMALGSILPTKVPICVDGGSWWKREIIQEDPVIQFHVSLIKSQILEGCLTLLS